MAFIPPIVSPLLQVIKELAGAVNETRQYLGLPPINADELIAKAYGEAPAAPAPQPAPTPAPAPQPAPAPTPAPAPAAAPAPEPAKSNATPDGTYYANEVVAVGSDYGFDPKMFAPSGAFVINVSGGKATFSVKSPLDAQTLDDWNMPYGGYNICEGSFDPFNSDTAHTDVPGEAQYVNGLWIVTKNAVLS